jgi:hypothetical protein
MNRDDLLVLIDSIKVSVEGDRKSLAIEKLDMLADILDDRSVNDFDSFDPYWSKHFKQQKEENNG